MARLKYRSGVVLAFIEITSRSAAVVALEPTSRALLAHALFWRLFAMHMTQQLHQLEGGCRSTNLGLFGTSLKTLAACCMISAGMMDDNCLMAAWHGGSLLLS